MRSRPSLGVLHAEPRAARLFEINIVRRGPVTANVELNRGSMKAFLVTVLMIAFAVAMVIGPIAWICAVVFSFKTAANRKQDVDLWRDAPMRNPWNIMLDSDLLTDEGLRCRRIAMKAVAWFAIPILLTLTLAAIIGELN